VTPDRPFSERGAFLSERGKRRVNQDAVLMIELPDGTELVAVADGMGGQAAGEVASTRAVEVLHTALRDGRDLVAGMQLANAAVLAESSGRPERAGMGTTLVALHRRGASYMVANVGDSRAYRIDSGGIRQLTQDHSFIAEAGQAGGLSLEEAERSPWRHAVTRAIGTEHALKIDCFGPHDAQEPHSVLLCTDGLYRVISDEDLMGAVVTATEPGEAVRALVAAAYRAGSDDNISLAILQFGAALPAAVPVNSTRPTDGAPRRRPAPARYWNSGADSVIFIILLILVVYMAIAGLMGR
jgi:PPM family protein phosphatase